MLRSTILSLLLAWSLSACSSSPVQPEDDARTDQTSSQEDEDTALESADPETDWKAPPEDMPGSKAKAPANQTPTAP